MKRWITRVLSNMSALIRFPCVQPVVLVLWTSVAVCDVSIAKDETPALPSGQCNIGPLNKTFGMTKWLVYGCTTDLNIVIVSAPGSPAFPFVFAFIAKDGKHELRGEGAGDKSATEAAFDELKTLSELDIAALLEAVKSFDKLKK